MAELLAVAAVSFAATLVIGMAYYYITGFISGFRDGWRKHREED